MNAGPRRVPKRPKTQDGCKLRGTSGTGRWSDRLLGFLTSGASLCAMSDGQIVTRAFRTLGASFSC